nr:sulfur carrier protein ThiS [Erwinia phyllosphaerae]
MTLADLLTQLCCQQAGTALAVNQQIVSRDRWSTYPLQEGDELVIFQAIAGG